MDYSDSEYFSAGGSNRKRRETMYFDCLDYTPTPTPTKNLNNITQDLIKGVSDGLAAGAVMKNKNKVVVKTPGVPPTSAIYKIPSKIPKLVLREDTSKSKPKLNQNRQNTEYPNNNTPTSTSTSTGTQTPIPIPLQMKSQTIRKGEKSAASIVTSTSATVLKPKKSNHFCCKYNGA